ncbi:MAG: hypothetical protein R3E13_01130 [Alphaproteobacteria bacterium]
MAENFKKAYYILPLAILAACAYTLDGANQNVKFETPGAYNASCSVYVEGLKYQVKPPQVVNLYKAKDDLIVDCLAPGGRRKVIEVTPEIETSAAWNAANAGVGLPWDYASGALFRYPDVIEIDFTGEPVSDPPLPAQNSPDIRQPEEYYLEEFRPSKPRMNNDRHMPPVEILPRERSSMSDLGGYNNAGSVFSEPENTASGDKGDLMNVIRDLGAQESNAPSYTESSGGPVPLLPGE